MKKELLIKKLDTFKSTFPDFLIAEKSGNIYVKLNAKSITKTVKQSGASVTKNTLHKIGEVTTWNFERSDIILITKTGRILLKSFVNKNFISLTHKIILQIKKGTYNNFLLPTKYINGLIECFFIGKKAEWIKEHPVLWNIRYFRSFKSLKDAKNALGYDFISSERFIKIIKGDFKAFEVMVYACRSHEERVNVINLIESKAIGDLIDYITMCVDNKREYYIPKGLNRLNELHDGEVTNMNLGKANNYSSTPVYYYSEIFEIWERYKLNFVVMDCPRSLFIEGQKQKHCIGSYGNQLLSGNSIFVTFYYAGERFDLQMKLNGEIVQFRGKRNKDAPAELKEHIKMSVYLYKSSNRVDDVITFRSTPYKDENILYKSADRLLGPAEEIHIKEVANTWDTVHERELDLAF